MEKLTTFIFLLLININCFGQQLNIGDVCPDFALTNVMNYKRSHFKISDFKEKMIILDFWNTGCTACIAGFSKLDSLQHAFNNRIQIILVNKETLDSTKRFFIDHPGIKLPDLPFITEDSILSQYFPHNTFPHQIWIDSSRIVGAITYGESATYENILAAIQGKKINLPLKEDVFDYNFDKSIFENGNKDIISRVNYYSCIAKGIGTKGFLFTKKAASDIGRPNRIYANASLFTLYNYAYGHSGEAFMHKTLLQCSDSMKTIFNDSYLNYYYDLMVPLNDTSKMFSFMQQDLNRFFGLKGFIEKRKIKCLVLVQKDTLHRLGTGGGRPSTNFFVGNVDTTRYMRNMPFSVFVGTLKNMINSNPAIKLPFINAVDYKGNIDIKINEKSDLSDLYILKNELRKNNLDILEQKRLTDVLIIK